MFIYLFIYLLFSHNKDYTSITFDGVDGLKAILTSKSFEFLIYKCTPFEGTRKMLIFLSSTTETNLFLRAASVIS